MEIAIRDEAINYIIERYSNSTRISFFFFVLINVGWAFSNFFFILVVALYLFLFVAVYYK
jgi:hypothetical protein